MLSRALGVLFVLGSGASWFGREAVKAWFFDRVVHMSDPLIDSIIEYGPPAALALIALWLLGAHKLFLPAPLRKKQEPSAGKPPEPSIAGSGGLPHNTPQPKPAPVASDWRHDAWLLDAVFYAVNGKWFGDTEVGADNQKLDKIFNIAQEMRDLAAEGRYDIWGKTDPEGLYEKIPAGFWVNNRIDILPVMTGDKPENFQTARVAGAGDGYSRLRVNKLLTEALIRCH
jgi:hypothetical protein